jgi:6-phosphofructokinase 2
MIITVTFNPSLDKSVTVDGLVVDETNRWTSYRQYPGGKGINVSRVIHILGGETIAYGFIGGIDGEVVQQLLKNQGVPFDFTPIKGEIRSNFIITDAKTNRQTRIDAPGPIVSEHELEALISKINGIRPKPDFLVFAGSIPPGVPDDIYRTLVNEAKKRGIKTVLDADDKWLRYGVKAQPTIIKPNIHEAEELLGSRFRNEATIITAVKMLLAQGVEIVALTRGRDSSVISNGKEIIKLTPPQVEVMGTVGAGDSAVAGLVLKLSQGAELEEAARLGVAAAVATTLQPGVELCHLEDVDRLLPLVKVERIQS